MEIFRLFKPEWQAVIPVKNVRINTSMSCTSCVALGLQVQEKHDLVLTLVNKGNDIQKQLQTSQEKEYEITNELQVIRKSNENFLKVLNKYEDSLQDAIAARDALRADNEENKRHLINLEAAFSDVHTKYEKSKMVVEINRENEIALWESIKENERTIIDLQHNYAKLKEESQKKLSEANETLHNMKQEHEEELNKYKTKIRTLEIKIDSLENSLQQKLIENEKLSSICEEFITSS